MKFSRWIVVAAAVAGRTAFAQANPPVAKPYAPFQGAWTILTVNGETAQPPMEVSFTGTKYAQTVGGSVTERGTFKVDTISKPMHFDLSIEEGSDKGKLQLGIAAFARDTLRFNLAPPSAPTRPASMTTPSVLIVAVRKK